MRQNLKHATNFLESLTLESLFLLRLLGAKVEALVDGSGSFSVAAAWQQT